MQAQCQVKEKKRLSSEMDQLLSQYIDCGVISSVRQIPGEIRTYRIAFSTSSSKETELLIRKTLDENGYYTSIHKQTYGAVHRRSGSIITSRAKYGTYSGRERGSVIIAKAKVNYPKPPQNPGGLPDPNGQKPKRRK